MAKRIIDYPETTEIAVDDYLVVGSGILGTRKLLASKIGGGGGGGDVTLIEKVFTENGIYLPSSYNADGFSKVTVDIGTGGNLANGYWIKTTLEGITKKFVQQGMTYNYNTNVFTWTPNSSYVGASLNGSVPIKSTGASGISKITFDISFGENYDHYNNISNVTRPFVIGVTDTLYDQYVYCSGDTVGNYFKAYKLYDGTYANSRVQDEINIPNLTGSLYLLIVFTGWNGTINDLVLS